MSLKAHGLGLGASVGEFIEDEVNGEPALHALLQSGSPVLANETTNG
jgi:hypothetical protein